MTTLKPHEILRRQPPQRLYPEGVQRVLLEEPKPIAESLEWRLSSRYWQRHGLAPFSDGSVPYVVNNSGWAPRAAAELVLTAGQACSGPLVVVEIAAGSGIFARQALDHLQHACRERGIDVYDRLTWVCTDGAAGAVAAWEERGQFLAHQGRVRTTTADAENLQALALPAGTVLGIVANYALDSLPVEVVRRGGERLMLQACVYGEASNLEHWLGMTLSEIRAHIDSSDPAALDALLPLLDWMEFSAVFVPGELPEGSAALDAAQSEVAMINVGAVRFLEGALSRLQPGGFVLVNDYGPTTAKDFEQQTFIHRFGGTFTGALNFPHLDRWLEDRGCSVLRPVNDEQRTIHTRLAVVGESTVLASAFAKWFGDPRYVAADRVGSWTTSYVAGGRLSEALDAFERHLEWCPTDWHQLAEAAQLLLQQFGQTAEALELANAARLLNPWSSTLVWNVYGSALFLSGSLEEAETAWTKAAEIDQKDPSTWLNFAFLHVARGQPQRALEAIASGLACDRSGELRAALLQKQAEILSGQSQQRTAHTDRLTRRHRALTDAIGPLKSDAAAR